MEGSEVQLCYFQTRVLVLLTGLCLFPSGLMRLMTANPFSVPVGRVQEVDGYFSTLGVECAVVIEEHRGHRLVYKFLNYPVAVFSFSLPLTYSSLVRSSLTRCSPASQEPVQLPWRTWQYLTHLEKGGV